MFKMIKIVGVSLVLATLHISQSRAEGYIGGGTITYLQNAYATEWILFTDGTNLNPDNCSQNLVMLQRAHLQFKELYALLLAAFLTQKKVSIYVSGCHSAGYKLLSFVGTSAP